MDTLTIMDWLNNLYAARSADKGKQIDVGGEEASPSEDDGSLLRLEKGQAWSMLVCAPLESTGELSLDTDDALDSSFGADPCSIR